MGLEVRCPDPVEIVIVGLVPDSDSYSAPRALGAPSAGSGASQASRHTSTPELFRDTAHSFCGLGSTLGGTSGWNPLQYTASEARPTLLAQACSP